MKRWARGCTLNVMPSEADPWMRQIPLDRQLHKDFAGVLLAWWAMPFQVSAGERNEK